MMWISVPQMPQAPTWTTTSFGPASGSGTFVDPDHAGLFNHDRFHDVSPEVASVIGHWSRMPMADFIHWSTLHLPVFGYFTAPIERPRTSWRCEIQPSMTTGAIAIVLAAESFAQKSPSEVMNFCMKSGTVDAFSVATRLTAKKNSFQAKIIERNAVAASPGPTIGSRICDHLAEDPGAVDAGGIETSRGTSSKNERSIQIAIGRFIAMYMMTRPWIVFSRWAFLKMM